MVTYLLYLTYIFAVIVFWIFTLGALYLSENVTEILVGVLSLLTLYLSSKFLGDKLPKKLCDRMKKDRKDHPGLFGD